MNPMIEPCPVILRGTDSQSPAIGQTFRIKPSWSNENSTPPDHENGKCFHGKDASGFTLLEILIAVLIFGTIMTTLFSAFRSFVVSSRLINSHIDRVEKGHPIMARIQRDFRALRIALPPEFSHKEDVRDNGDPYAVKGETVYLLGKTFSLISFASLAHLPFGGDPRVGAARITYYPRENPQGGLDLCRRDTLHPEPPEDLQSARSPCDPVICRNITAFELTYVDQDGQTHDHWDSDADSFDFATPSAIHIRIRFRSSDRSLHRLTDTINTDETHSVSASFSDNPSTEGGMHQDDVATGGNGMWTTIETQIDMPVCRRAL